MFLFVYDIGQRYGRSAVWRISPSRAGDTLEQGSGTLWLREKSSTAEKTQKKACTVAGVSDDGTGLPSGTEAGRVIGFGENYCMLWPAAPTVWGTQQLALSSPEAATKASAIFVEVTVSDRAVSAMTSMAMLPAAPT